MEQNGNVKSKLTTELNLDVAIARVHKNIVSSCFPNRLDAAIIKQCPTEVKERVEGLLDATSMDWANGSARFFDLPKSDKLVRPICYLDVDIAVVYQALVDAASTTIEPYIVSAYGERILSQRLRGCFRSIRLVLDLMYEDANHTPATLPTNSGTFCFPYSRQPSLEDGRARWIYVR